jgi:hypothetical protein
MKTEDQITAKLESKNIEIDYWKGMAEDATRQKDECLKNQCLEYMKKSLAEQTILKWILSF